MSKSESMARTFTVPPEAEVVLDAESTRLLAAQPVVVGIVFGGTEDVEMDVGDPALHQLMDGLNQIRKALDRHNARNVNQPPRPPAIIAHDPTDYLLSLLPHGVEVTDHDAVGDDDALLDWRARSAPSSIALGYRT